eukprot:Nk52_evm1s2581 gene=Nk52_evmTU1s2581
MRMYALMLWRKLRAFLRRLPLPAGMGFRFMLIGLIMLACTFHYLQKEKRQFVFGYGSYMAPYNRAAVLRSYADRVVAGDGSSSSSPGAASSSSKGKPNNNLNQASSELKHRQLNVGDFEFGFAVPARLMNYRRGWSFISPFSTTLAAMRWKFISMNGVLFEVSADELDVFDQHNKEYFRRERVSFDDVRFLYTDMTLPPDAIIWVYVVKHACGPSRSCPILQSYLDVCMDGARQYGETFAKEFVITTDVWPDTSTENGAWLNDRDLEDSQKAKSKGGKNGGKVGKYHWPYEGKAAEVRRRKIDAQLKQLAPDALDNRVKPGQASAESHLGAEHSCTCWFKKDGKVECPKRRVWEAPNITSLFERVKKKADSAVIIGKKLDPLPPL